MFNRVASPHSPPALDHFQIPAVLHTFSVGSDEPGVDLPLDEVVGCENELVVANGGGYAPNDGLIQGTLEWN